MCVRGWNLFPLSIIEKDSPFLVALVVKNLPANAGDIIDLGSVPGWGRSLGGGHGNPLQYSCQENPMDRGTWRGAYNPWNQKELDDWSDLACMHTQLESRYTFKYINKSFKKKKPTWRCSWTVFSCDFSWRGSVLKPQPAWTGLGTQRKLWLIPPEPVVKFPVKSHDDFI